MIRFVGLYFIYFTKGLMRNISALFFNLLFPAILFMFFGHAENVANEFVIYIAYCNFAVQTLMLQGLGITLSGEYYTPWRTHLKTLPVSQTPVIIGRLLSCLLFALLSILFITLKFACSTHLSVSYYQYFLIIITALAGGIPMGLLALWLSPYLNPSASRGAFIMLNTLLFFSAISYYSGATYAIWLKALLSTQWLMLSVALLSGTPIWSHFFWVLSYTLLFGLLIGLSQKYTD